MHRITPTSKATFRKHIEHIHVSTCTVNSHAVLIKFMLIPHRAWHCQYSCTCNRHIKYCTSCDYNYPGSCKIATELMWLIFCSHFEPCDIHVWLYQHKMIILECQQNCCEGILLHVFIFSYWLTTVDFGFGLLSEAQLWLDLVTVFL